MTNLSPELISAYEATNFHVKAKPAFVFKVGILSNEIGMLFRHYDIQCAAFITAYNPYSKTLSEKDNQERNERLMAELNERELDFIDGFGRDPLGKWAGEPSFVVLGANIETAIYLGEKFEQNAIVFIESDLIPRLILLR